MKTKCPLPKGFSGTRRTSGILLSLLVLSLIGAPAAIGAPFAYIANSGSNNVSVIDGGKVGIPGAGAVQSVTADPSLPFSLPWGVAVNATGTRAYVANYGDSSLSVIDTASNSVVAKVRVGYLPIGIAVNAADTRVYVANSGDGSVSVIDTAKIGTQSNPVVATIATGEFLYGVAVNPAGTYVYVTDWAFSSRTGIVRVIDAGSNTLFKSISVGMFPVGIGVSPSGGRVYVANSGSGTVSVIDTSTNTVPLGWTLQVGASPAGIAVSPSGLLVYVAKQGGVSVIWAPTNALYATVPIANSPFGIATDPAGARYFVGNQDGTVSVIDSATNTAVAPPVTVGGNPLVFGAFVGSAPSAPSCDDQLASLRQQLDAATSTITNLQSQVQSLQQQLDAAKSTIATLTTRNNTLQSQVQSLQQQLDAAKSTITTLTTQNNTLQSQVQSLQQQLNAAQSTITTLTTQNNTLQSQVQSLQQQLVSLSAEYDKLKSDLAGANATIAAQNQTIDSLVNHLFGAKVDVFVAAAARDAAYRVLSRAVAKISALDPRVREAQREYRDGLNALAKGEYQRAVVYFRQTFHMAQRISQH